MNFSAVPRTRASPQRRLGRSVYSFKAQSCRWVKCQCTGTVCISGCHGKIKCTFSFFGARVLLAHALLSFARLFGQAQCYCLHSNTSGNPSVCTRLRYMYIASLLACCIQISPCCERMARAGKELQLAVTILAAPTFHSQQFIHNFQRSGFLVCAGMSCSQTKSVS